MVYYVARQSMPNGGVIQRWFDSEAEAQDWVSERLQYWTVHPVEPELVELRSRRDWVPWALNAVMWLVVLVLVLSR